MHRLTRLDLLFPFKPDITKPVLQFFEEGNRMRIETQGFPVRYLSQKNAVELLRYIGTIAFEDGKELQR